MARSEFDKLPDKGDLLKELVEPKQVRGALLDEQKRQEIGRQIQQKQVEIRLMMGKQKQPGRQK